MTNNNKETHQSKSPLLPDTSIIAILPLDTQLHWIFNSGKTVELTADDLVKIEMLLQQCIDEYKFEKTNFIIDLTRYRRQYMAAINSKGEKEVWINCFCENWKTSAVLVVDGGNCFFNLKVNLATGNYYELSINGES